MTHTATHPRTATCLVLAAACLLVGCRQPGWQSVTDASPVHDTGAVPGAIQPVTFESDVQPPRPSTDASVASQAIQDSPTAASAEVLQPRTLGDFEELALQNHPALGEASARVDAANGAWYQAGLRPNPTIGYSGQQLGAGGIAEQQGAYLGQTFITGKKLQLQREAAAWEAERAEYDLEATRMRVLTDVRIAFYDVVLAQRRRDLATRIVATSDQAVEAAEALYRGKEVSRADPLRARVAAETARITLVNAVKQHEAAWRKLAAAAGAESLALQPVTGDITPDQWEFEWDSEIQRLLDESPQLAAALADVEAARWKVERAYAEVIPNVDVQAVVQDDQGTGNTNANLQVTLPLPLWNRNQGGIQEAFGNALAAEQEVDRVMLGLRSRLASAFQRYESARNQVNQYSRDDGILVNARQTLELIRSGYRAGEFSILDLLAAQRTFFQTNLAYLDALGELAISASEIQGLLLRDSLSP